MSRLSGFYVGFVGFIIAGVGVAAGFAGFVIERRWLSLLAFAITVLGLVIGFIGIAYRWVTSGSQAFQGSLPAAKDLAAKIKRYWK